MYTSAHPKQLEVEEEKSSIQKRKVEAILTRFTTFSRQDLFLELFFLI